MTIKLDKRNYRKHNDRNKGLIKKSLEELGAGRSILIDSENEIIGGNGVYEQAQSLNIPVRVIETDGSELIAVKRTDLKTDDEKRKQLAIMDNSTSDSSEFDFELLQDDFDVDTLNGLGVDIDIKQDDEDDTYTSVVNIPQYDVKGDDVNISDLVDKEKVNELVRDIEQSSVPEEIKDFLKIAAYRHYVFNYRKIAEFYSKAEKSVQELFEKSALVIIDYDNAIANAFTTLDNTIESVFDDDEE